MKNMKFFSNHNQKQQEVQTTNHKHIVDHEKPQITTQPKSTNHKPQSKNYCPTSILSKSGNRNEYQKPICEYQGEMSKISYPRVFGLKYARRRGTLLFKKPCKSTEI